MAENKLVDLNRLARYNEHIKSKINDTESKLEGYLPLTGGTMSGSITFESELDTNGHEYVDLGLPSGNLWAKCNIGASSEEEAGLYFQWGDTQGYTAEQVGNEEGQKEFSWTDYKFSIDGSGSNFSKYNISDGKTVLDLEDDAAHVNMGGSWRMPTIYEYGELLLNTDVYLVTTDGTETKGRVEVNGENIDITWVWESDPQGKTLKGIKAYKKGDNQIFLFIPRSNLAMNGSFQDENTFLWTSSQAKSSNTSFAPVFYLGGADTASYGKLAEFPIRGVCSKSYTGNIITVLGKTSTDLLNAAGSTTSIDEIKAQVQASIVDSAPETLDTLNELAAALGDDPNFATTIATQIGNKQDALVSGTNIKTLGGESILGSGNFEVASSSDIQALFN